MKLVSVIIANYNGMRFLPKVLSSLKAQRFRDFEVIVVDDGSADGSPDYIAKEHRWVRLIRFPKNRGFVHAQNAGIAAAKGTYVFLLDNDTWFGPGWLGKVVAQAKKHPDAAIVSAKIWDRDKVAFRKANPTLQHTINLFGYLIWHDYRALDGFQVFAVGSGFSMYRKALLPTPPFDPDYKAYAADIAMCYRMTIMGKRIIMADAITNHFGGGTFRNRPAYAYIDAERNRVINILIHYQGWTLFRLVPLLALSLILHNLYTFPRLLYNLRAYGWIILHPGKIASKRAQVQAVRAVGDKELTRLLSSKLFDERQVGPWLRVPLSALNLLSRIYLKIVRIPTIDG